MKRLLALLILFSLALAGSLPKDARYDQPVSNIGTNLPLQALLEALAKSVGLSPVLQDIPDVRVNADIDKKPFRQVWDLLINVYGDGKLDYALLENGVILVGAPARVARAVPQQPVAQAQTPATPAEPTTREFYEVRSSEPAQLAQFIEQEVRGVTARVAPGGSALVVTGTARQQAEVASLLQRIDRPRAAATPTIQKTYKLANARAVDLVAVLEKALGSGGAAPAAGGAQAAPTTAAASVSAVADPRSNSLIVTATPDQIAQVDRLIQQLDLAVPQVQLQVRVQAVNSTVTRNLGIKWETLAGGNLLGSIFGAAGSGLNLIFDATRSLSSLNIRAVFDALEKQDLSRRLSDANLLVENNYGADTGDLRATGAKAAEIKSGGTLLVPLATAAQTENVNFREIDFGLTVRLRPQITSDGQVLLEIFTQTGEVPQAGPQNSILIPQRTTLSRFSLRDGQTVVLGGLIQRLNTSVESKVPLLGDIPLLGELFKSRSTTVQEEELIVIITANILKNAASQ